MIQSSGGVVTAEMDVGNLSAKADAELMQVQALLAQEQARVDALRSLEARYMASLQELIGAL